MKASRSYCREPKFTSLLNLSSPFSRDGQPILPALQLVAFPAPSFRYESNATHRILKLNAATKFPLPAAAYKKATIHRLYRDVITAVAK